jgi:hypothetical protein
MAHRDASTAEVVVDQRPMADPDAREAETVVDRHLVVIRDDLGLVGAAGASRCPAWWETRPARRPPASH